MPHPNLLSTIADHTRQTGHHLSLAKFQILRREDDWGLRGITEGRPRTHPLSDPESEQGAAVLPEPKWDRPLGVSPTILPPDDGHRNNV